MKARLYGRVTGQCAVSVGAWDPFLPSHRDVLEQLRSHAHRRSLASVAILLDPAPPVFIWGRHDWPIFDDVATRIKLVRRCGIDGVLLVRVFRADVAASAGDFFATMLAHLSVAELWLGTHQTLGAGPRGRATAIHELSEENDISVHRLPPVRLATEDVRRFLAAGRLREAIRVVGRAPVRRRPDSLAVRLAWLPGRYQAVALDDPIEPAEGPRFSVELVRQANGLPRLQWPERSIRFLAFVGGPGEDPSGT